MKSISFSRSFKEAGGQQKTKATTMNNNNLTIIMKKKLIHNAVKLLEYLGDFGWSWIG